MSNGPRILIPSVAGIGNALLIVPMVRALKRAQPQARITILARTEAIAEVFRRLPEVDEAIVVGKGVKGLWLMIRAARARHGDVYLVPFPSNRWQYALLALTSGARRRILHGYPVGYWRAMHFVGERVPAERGLHDVEQNLRLLSAMGIDASPEPPVFALNESDRAGAEALFAQVGVDPRDRPIIIHAGSARTILAQAKRWPAASYAKLIAQMARELSDPICLIEGPDERGVADEILAAGKSVEATLPTTTHPRIIRLTGSLGVAGALLERARLYVGSDSGLAHLAAAVGTPTVTLFAPADPDRVSPHGDRELVVQAPTTCSPCFQYPWNATHPCMRCREPMCITMITVDQVMEAMRRALEDAHGEPIAKRQAAAVVAPAGRDNPVPARENSA